MLCYVMLCYVRIDIHHLVDSNQFFFSEDFIKCGVALSR